jgi:succinoglycan biosynthesis protein ExoU
LTDGTIAVIVPAYNAESTIAQTIKSSLSARQVAEVFVVDDCSTDRTFETAVLAANNDQRCKVVQQETNMGPSAARNRALRETKSPLIAIVDADDYILPGRFDSILSDDEWDMCADNIVFFSSMSEIEAFTAPKSALEAEAVYMGFEQFVHGNISDRKQSKGELGFLKPVMKRSFLEQYDLKYSEDCRLGEDFVLYTKALANGARFKVRNSCGYAALTRGDSLSSTHGIEELTSLREKCLEMLLNLPLTVRQRKSLEIHSKSVLRKIQHRQVLDVRRRKGIIEGTLAACCHPSTIVDILLDRLTPMHGHIQTPRMLFSSKEWAELGS